MQKWQYYLEDAEILFKGDATLWKILLGRTDICKLGIWSLELQASNIRAEHTIGTKNKAADCLSRLLCVAKKQNDSLCNTTDKAEHLVNSVVGDNSEDECRL